MKYLYLLPLLISSFFGNTQELLDEHSSIDVSIPFSVVENVPVYKGCSKKLDNNALKNCMFKSIQKHVLKTFNRDIAHRIGLTGQVRIMSQFIIDKEGLIKKIRIRAPHDLLEKEAIRVIKLIPKTEKPALNRGKPANISYFLPITFNIEENKAIEKKPVTKKRQNN